jgi:IS1 family transposase
LASLSGWSAVGLAAITNKVFGLQAFIVSTEGKTDCKHWNSDDWGGYERLLPPEILHYIGKDKTQRLERTNGLM